MTLTPDQVDLTTRLGDMVLASPVLVASGCGGDGRALVQQVDLASIGAFVTPSVTRDPNPGMPRPRSREVPSGIVTANGMPNPGIDGFLATQLPWLLQQRIRPIVSIAGATLGEFAELARRVGNSPGVAGIEVNLSLGYARDPVLGARAVGVVRRETPPGVPVLAKLWAGVSAITDLAAAVVQAGADAVVLTGSRPGLVLDPRTLRPALGGVEGELSGPAVRAAGLYAVWEVRQQLADACIVGSGGIGSGAEALEYLAVGADAVQIGSVLLSDPGLAQRVVPDLRDAMAAHGLRSVREATGVARRESLVRADPPIRDTERED